MIDRTSRIDPPDESAIVVRLRAAGCVFAEDEARLLVDAAGAGRDLAAMVDRRAAGEPLEYVLGWAEFCGRRISVEPGVFVPRRRTELVVREAIRLSTESRLRPIVVDLCCGSGAIGLAVVTSVTADAHPAELHAVDLDPVAARCARRNLFALEGAAVGTYVYEGDLYEPLPAALRGRVSVLIANAPYVPTDSIGLLPPEARLHESRIALDGGADGLDVLRRVTAEATEWLAPSGHLLVETSDRQAPHMADAMARAGLIPRIASAPEIGGTVVVGRRPIAAGR
ncbi:MAG TPA: putative protein N(5)-glutamine methyltransferase [Micromonosporaceae bacterium]|nr:putative protein N(5)-glutamine methyltransferase [Micromonosporaceae bacterium]